MSNIAILFLMHVLEGCCAAGDFCWGLLLMMVSYLIRGWRKRRT